MIDFIRKTSDLYYECDCDDTYLHLVAEAEISCGLKLDLIDYLVYNEVDILETNLCEEYPIHKIDPPNDIVEKFMADLMNDGKSL